MKNANTPKIKQPIVTELTENKIDEYVTRREFEGKYIPYKTARQFSSIGNASSEQLGQEAQRHEYFSDMERYFGLTLSYLKNVFKIKTQYPLIDVDTTLAVATRLNIAHPRYAPKSGLVKDANKGYQAAIMTTDFYFQYADIDLLAETCKFSNCQHTSEPGCAVQQAIEAGNLDPRRLTNYLKLLAEQERNGAALHEKRAKDKEFGKMVKSVMADSRQTKNRY